MTDIVNKHADPSASDRPIANQAEIEYCFKPDSIQDIVARLENVASGSESNLDSEFAAATLKKMKRYSPISMAVVVE